MTPLDDFITRLCAEIQEIEPDWEDCPTCGPIIPFIKNRSKTAGISPIKRRVRTLLGKIKYSHPDRYKILNDEFKRL